MHLLLWNQELIPIVEVFGPDYKRVAITPGCNRRCRVEARICGLQLNTGRYAVSVIVLSPDGMTTLCQVDQAFELRVNSNHGSGSSVLWRGDWTIASS